MKRREIVQEEEEAEKSGEKVTISAQKKGEFLRGSRSRRRRKFESLLVACKRGFGNAQFEGPTPKTPVISWKEVVSGGAQNTIIKANNFLLLHPSSLFSPTSSVAAVFSARKLASAIWEFQHYYYFSSSIMYNNSSNHHHQRGRRFHHRMNNDEGFDHQPHHHHQQQQQLNNHPSLPVDPHRSATPDHQPASAGSLRRHIAAALMRHQQSAERNKHALQPLSPASYGSSLEMAPYNPAATPDSSIELRGRIGESSYSFKTSTELLKVLNRIWTLEEQHASNVSLVKALKNELDHARGRIKELLRDQQANRHEIDELMKQISEDSLGRKSKEHERMEAALQSVRDELEDERKLRKRSESLHRKLAREIFEIKVALSTTVKELEKERKSSELLEELCDEFAKTIREYAKQVHDVKQKSDRDWTGITDQDNLILHISESWLDERAQKKDREAQKSSVVDNLRPDIETFLTARQTADKETKDADHNESRLRRRSLESIPEVGATPENSVFTDSRFAEISKVGPSHYAEQEELALNGGRKGQSPPSVQMSEPHTTPQEADSGVMKTGEGTPTEISMLQKSDIYDSYQKKKNYNEEGNGSNSKTVDKLISELLLSEGSSYPPKYEYKEASASNNASTLKRNASPVRQWVTSMKSPDPKISESSSKMQSLRENSLKAKLQEPKSKGHRSRLKILKGSS